MKPKRRPVASALDALDFTLESQQMQSELRQFLTQMLPLLDTIEKVCRGIERLSPEELAGKAAALALLPEIANAACKSVGLKRFGAVGEPIDSRSYQVVETKADESVAKGTVLEVLEPGWELDGNALRHAQVIAAKGE